MTASAPELSIVIPVYNEPDNIPIAIDALTRHIDVPHEIIVVYDFEADTTLPVLREIQSRQPNVRAVRNSIARGPSGALRTGFANAVAPLVLVTMADLCDDVSQVSAMIRLARAGADIVAPSRYCKDGRQELEESLKVKAPRLAGRLVHVLAGLPTVDPTNSFKLYSADLLRRLRLRSTVSFSVTLEIVAKAHCHGCRIVEIPTVWRDRRHGQTNFKLGRSLVTYLPWFCVAMLGAPVFRVRRIQRWFASQLHE